MTGRIAPTHPSPIWAKNLWNLSRRCSAICRPNWRLLSNLLLALCTVITVSAAKAGADHDHSHDPAPKTATAPAPRFAAQSESFEVVGVLQGEALAVFVDRFEDNAPVLEARVELESGSFKALGELDAERGSYRFDAAAFKGPGSYPIQIMLTVSGQTDLLGADLVVPDPHEGHVHAADQPSLYRYAGWAGGGAMVLLGLFWALRRSRLPEATR